MYIGVDIGGTKTLLAVLNPSGVIVEKLTFPTPKNYDEFLAELKQNVASLEHQDYRAAGVAVPGRLNREYGLVLELGNLPWQKEPIQADCEKILNCPVLIENDAKLAGLSEAMLNRDAETILYITVSTGIGTAVIENQKLDPAMLDSEGGHMILPFKGQLTPWETFASGHAIYDHFGKKAVDIDPSDLKAWGYIARNLSVGIFELITTIGPDLIIIGGSIGAYFDNYSGQLESELKKYETPYVKIPKLIKAQRPEEAVIYGCYDLVRQVFNHANYN
jgi:predicted NBD/HSP70 family sugar kinase